MTRTLYDAIAANQIPAGAALIAGYGDGLYNDFGAERVAFPNARVVEIAVFAEDDLGVVLDVEKGNAAPAQAPGWVVKRRAAGVDPTVYCSLATWPSVKAAFTAAGVAQPHFWIAAYDGDPTIPAGAVAKQYQDVGPYDRSSVADYWPGVDPVPVVTPPVTTPEEDSVLNFAIPAEAAEMSGATFARGKYTNVSFFADNTFVGGPTDTGAELRVVLWASGVAAEIHQVKVTNANSLQTVVPFTNALLTHTVTITRSDAHKYPVFVEIS